MLHHTLQHMFPNVTHVATYAETIAKYSTFVAYVTTYVPTQN